MTSDPGLTEEEYCQMVAEPRNWSGKTTLAQLIQRERAKVRAELIAITEPAGTETPPEEPLFGLVCLTDEEDYAEC